MEQIEGLIFLLIVGALYSLPSIVAFRRPAPSPNSVLVINLFLGWTLIGWIVAMAMAVREQAPNTVIYTQAPLQTPIEHTKELVRRTLGEVEVERADVPPPIWAARTSGE